MTLPILQRSFYRLLAFSSWQSVWVVAGSGQDVYITSCVTAKAQSVVVDVDHTVSERDCYSELAIQSKIC